MLRQWFNGWGSLTVGEVTGNLPFTESYPLSLDSEPPYAK